MRVIFAGGATGGHLYPALAVAEKLKRKFPDMEALFITSKREISSEIIESSGYSVRGVDLIGFNRRKPLKNIPALKALLLSSKQINRIFKEFMPDIVIGTGGNVSGCVVRLAHKKGIPTFLQEQNVLPGFANKLAEKYANKIFVAFEKSREYFKSKEKIVVTGNPVRRAFVREDSTDYRKKLECERNDLVLLIFGGSQGARLINETVSQLLISIKDRKDTEVFFITGHRMYESILEEMTEEGVTNNKKIHILPYYEDIFELYAASDIIISRSGALSVSEIAIMGKPSILIPSPNVSENHQYYNAKALADEGAAVLLEEDNLSVDTLENSIYELWSDKKRLSEMSDMTLKVSRKEAADVIVESIMEDIANKR